MTLVTLLAKDEKWLPNVRMAYYVCSSGRRKRPCFDIRREEQRAISNPAPTPTSRRRRRRRVSDETFSVKLAKQRERNTYVVLLLRTATELVRALTRNRFQRGSLSASASQNKAIKQLALGKEGRCRIPRMHFTDIRHRSCQLFVSEKRVRLDPKQTYLGIRKWCRFFFAM